MNNKMIKFNLLDKTIYHREKNYALRYTKKSAIPKLSFILVIVIAVLAICLPESWLRMIEKDYDIILIISIGSLILCATLGTLIFARCPKCKKVQPAGYGGMDISNNTGLDYTKGFTPFRKRCCFCGTYFSVKQLEKDKHRQQNEMIPPTQ